MTSPCDIAATRPPSVRSVMGPDGTMIQTARGGWSFDTTSSSETASSAPAATACWRASWFGSNATTWWPNRISRAVMFPPIRPSPTMPIFMVRSPLR